MTRPHITTALTLALALCVGCDDPPAPSEPVTASERASEPGAPPEDLPKEAPDDPEPEPEKNTCIDPSKAPEVVCKVAGPGKITCCLEGCTDTVEPLDPSALSLLTDPGGATATTHEREGHCVAMSLQAPAEETEEDAASDVIGVSINPAALPIFKEEVIPFQGASPRFHDRMWWCPIDRAKTCQRLVNDRKTPKLVVLHPGPLLRSEVRRLTRLKSRLEKQLGGPLQLDDVPPGPRFDQLSTWLDTRRGVERALLPIDEAILSEGLAIVIRWAPPRVEERRNKMQHFSRGLDRATLVTAPPKEPVRELLWTTLDPDGMWQSEEPHWLELLALRAHQTLQKEARNVP